MDWAALPDAQRSAKDPDQFDAVVVGSGLGGLSCAAAFQRPGGFTFDVSLHSTSVGERNGIRNLIDGFPEISGVEFVPHPYLYRAIFPEHDINRISTARTSLDMNRFPADFPTLSRCANQTWGAMMDYQIRDPKLAGLSRSWRLLSEGPFADHFRRAGETD